MPTARHLSWSLTLAVWAYWSTIATCSMPSMGRLAWWLTTTGSVSALTCSTLTSADRLACNMPLTLTFTFGGTDYPMHPLDMSYIDTEDPSFSRCLGVLQYADLNNRGDL